MESETPLEKVSIRLVKSDVDTLRRIYPTAGYNFVLRTVVSRFVRRLEEKLSQQGLETPDGSGITVDIAAGDIESQ